MKFLNELLLYMWALGLTTHDNSFCTLYCLSWKSCCVFCQRCSSTDITVRACDGREFIKILGWQFSQVIHINPCLRDRLSLRHYYYYYYYYYYYCYHHHHPQHDFGDVHEGDCYILFMWNVWRVCQLWEYFIKFQYRSSFLLFHSAFWFTEYYIRTNALLYIIIY